MFPAERGPQGSGQGPMSFSSQQVVPFKIQATANLETTPLTDLCIIDVVHLIKYDPLHITNNVRSIVQHGPKHRKRETQNGNNERTSHVLIEGIWKQLLHQWTVYLQNTNVHHVSIPMCEDLHNHIIFPPSILSVKVLAHTVRAPKIISTSNCGYYQVATWACRPFLSAIWPLRTRLQYQQSEPHLKISVVIMRQEASLFSCTSPVSRPTSPNVFLKSRNFWLERALIGDV